MTKLEKKAEEYFCEYCENSFEHDNGHCSNCPKWDYFIAGLTEGRKEKLHDLRKNPDDLPKENGHYWCYVDDGIFHTDYGVIYFEDGKWESEKWENKTIILIWCELPKFEE